MATEEGKIKPVRKQVRAEVDSKGSEERVLALSCGSSSRVGSSTSMSSLVTRSSSVPGDDPADSKPPLLRVLSSLSSTTLISGLIGQGVGTVQVQYDERDVSLIASLLYQRRKMMFASFFNILHAV